MKSLLLATACFYMAPIQNPPPQVAEHMVPEVLKRAYAMQPGTKKEVTVTQDNLCYKVALEPIDASALDIERRMPGPKLFGIEEERIPRLRCDNVSTVRRPGETSMRS